MCARFRTPADVTMMKAAIRSPATPSVQGWRCRPLRLRKCDSRVVVANLFTGIVQGTADIADLQQKSEVTSFQVAFPHGATKEVAIGASVALNGTCLTVTTIDKDTLSFDVIPETLRRTNLGTLVQGSKVNFERSVRYGDEVGGHNVSGHIHTTAEIVQLEQSADNSMMKFKVADVDWMKYIMPKGFIAVDGCSLTVGEVGEDWFKVYLIPETMRVTVLGTKQEGDSANVEIEAQTQAIVTAVERVVKQYLQASPSV
eukprot:jgi/Ulvmu1/7788/UM004_0017.1